MNAILFSFMQSQTPQGGGGWEMIIMMVVLFAIVYFFMIRPQNKKQKEIQKFRDALSIGQDIVTIGGIHGTIKSIDGNVISVEVATGTKIKFERSAIMPAGTAPEQK